MKMKYTCRQIWRKNVVLLLSYIYLDITLFIDCWWELALVGVWYCCDDVMSWKKCHGIKKANVVTMSCCAKILQSIHASA